MYILFHRSMCLFFANTISLEICWWEPCMLILFGQKLFLLFSVEKPGKHYLYQEIHIKSFWCFVSLDLMWWKRDFIHSEVSFPKFITPVEWRLPRPMQKMDNIQNTWLALLQNNWGHEKGCEEWSCSRENQGNMLSKCNVVSWVISWKKKNTKENSCEIPSRICNSVEYYTSVNFSIWQMYHGYV